jgi:hypothetical protein
MFEELENPTSNRLSGGITREAVVSAIERSGYPLQTFVAAELRGRDWYVQEEWSYIDSELGGLRALDIAAEVQLGNLVGQRVYPTLTLLAECKHSEMPYVFFESSVEDDELSFPVLAGLRHRNIEITDDGFLPGGYEPNVLQLLGLADDAFVRTPRRCVTFSKCVRKGSDLILSGTEPYQALVLPLLKAVGFYTRQAAPADTWRYFHPKLTVPLAIIAAPLTLATLELPKPELALCPWLRLYRHESEPQPEITDPNARERLHALDVVHADFPGHLHRARDAA